jgi:hypothetical protein
MPVQCWSFHRNTQDVQSLPKIDRTGLREFASLGSPATGFELPARLLIQGKATFRQTTIDGQPLQAIQTLLIDTLLGPDKPLDSAWCALSENPVDAVTISVLATVDAPARTGSRFRPHVISWRVDPEGASFEIKDAWLTAVGLDALSHLEGK